MSEVMDDVADGVERRAFLYDDPVSFRAGVRETVRALNAILERLLARRDGEAAWSGRTGKRVSGR